MAIELDLQIHNKKRIAIMSGIMIALTIYTLSDISNQHSPEPYTAAKTSTSTPANESGDEAVAAATNNSELQIVSINPFIELKEFDPTVQNISDMTNTSSYENSSTTRARPSNIPLPAIPNYNGHINYQERPQSIPAPAIAIKPEQPITVQGIGTGNSGNNIAILSDGRVVSEGDTYNDGRITYIGGDGITFDNGEKLQYK